MTSRKGLYKCHTRRLSLTRQLQKMRTNVIHQLHNAPHSLTHSLTHKRTHARTHSPTHSFTHARTHSLTHSRMHARTLTKTHTHTHTHTFSCDGFVTLFENVFQVPITQRSSLFCDPEQTNANLCSNGSHPQSITGLSTHTNTLLQLNLTIYPYHFVGPCLQVHVRYFRELNKVKECIKSSSKYLNLRVPRLPSGFSRW